MASITKEELENDYLVEMLSTLEIKNKYGIGVGTLYSLFSNYGIKTRGKSEGCRISKAKKVNADLDFFRKDSHDKYYVLGLIASDGNVHKNGIKLALKDYELVEKYHNLISCTNPIKRNVATLKGKEYVNYSATFSSEEVVSILKSHGICERKSLDFMPQNIPNEYLSSFIRGIFDGDGSVSFSIRKDTGALASKFSIVSASEEFVTYLQRIFNELGVSVNKITKDKRGNGIYTVAVGKRDSIAILTKWMYGDELSMYGLSRKKEKMIAILEKSREKGGGQNQPIQKKA